MLPWQPFDVVTSAYQTFQGKHNAIAVIYSMVDLSDTCLGF